MFYFFFFFATENIVKELENFLSDITEIEGTLKVTRSFPLLSFNFFKKLKYIRGKGALLSDAYSVYIIDNANLQALFPNDNLKVERGKMFFHFNPKLCMSIIRNFTKSFTDLEGTNFSSLDVSNVSNGDRVACNITKIEATVGKALSSNAIIHITPLTYTDDRNLLGYSCYYMPAQEKNITIYDGRDACGGDGWKVTDATNSPQQHPVGGEKAGKINVFLSFLEAYTQYAFYVKTYTIATETNGGQSDIQYFRTAPSDPSPVRQLIARSNSSDEIVIKWEPPIRPNGNLTTYIIVLELKYDSQKQLLEQRNYCNERKYLLFIHLN